MVRSSMRMERRPRTDQAGPYALEGKRVWVAGHRGMVGAALMRRLARESCELLTVDRRTVDLTRQEAVERWMARRDRRPCLLLPPRWVAFLPMPAHPAEFLYDNLMIEANIIHAAWKTGVEKLLSPRLLVHLSQARATAHH